MARWGKAAHITFLFFCFAANIIVTSMLLLGGAATVEALTGVDLRLAAFLIPWGTYAYIQILLFGDRSCVRRTPQQIRAKHLNCDAFFIPFFNLTRKNHVV